MFRQDPAWTKTLRFATHVSTVPYTTEMTSSVDQNQQILGSFESELEKTTQWMNQSYSTLNKKSNVHDTAIPYQMSERSKKFDIFLPTFTPFFLGDIIRDDELDSILKELLLEAEKDETEDPACVDVNDADVTDAELSASYQTESSIASAASSKRKKTKRKKKSKAKNNVKSNVNKEYTCNQEDLWIISHCNGHLNFTVQSLLDIMDTFHFELMNSFVLHSPDESISTESSFSQVFQISRKAKPQTMDYYLMEKRL